MKNLFVSLVSAAVLFAIGCQENSITEPVVNEPIDKVQSGSPETYLHDFIRLEGALNDPYPIGNSFYVVSGLIEYEQRTVYVDPMLPTAQRYASLYFTTDAEFRYLCTVCPPSEEDNLAGFISDVSEEFVPLGGNFVSLLEKTYAIQGRDDGMTFKVRFLVTSNGVDLSATWLALPNANVIPTNNNHY
ncbi:MAG TPA: hypothetical protein VLH59_15730 [Ignavibacteriaceae bacterium]|nr:hypothetical protein [Ignavibacteriaceae bacterium]